MSLHKVTLWCCMLGLAVATPVHASDAPVMTLSLSQAVDLALKQNEALHIARHRMERVRQQYREIRSSALPQLTGAVSWNHYFQSPKITLPGEEGQPPTRIPIKRDWELSAGLTLRQVLWGFGKVLNAIEAAQNAISVETLSKDAAQDDIIFQTKGAYFNLVLAQRLHDIMLESHQNALANKKTMHTRFRDGRVSRFENVKMEADIAQRAPLVLGAQNAVTLALDTLKVVLALPADQDIALSDTFQTEDTHDPLEDLTQTLLAKNTSLKVLEETIELRDRLATQAKRQYLPTLSGIAAYEYSGDSDSAYVGSDNMSPTFLAGLSLTFPLWDSGAISGRYHQALEERAIVALQLQQTKRSLLAELKSAVSERQILVRTYKANRLGIDLATKSYQISQGDFAAGKLSQTQLNDAEWALTNARLSAEQTLFRLATVDAKIQHLLSSGGAS